MMTKSKVRRIYILTSLPLLVMLGSTTISSGEIVNPTSCNVTSWNVGPEYLIFAQNIDDVMTISLTQLKSNITLSADFAITMDYTRYLAYFPGYIAGVFVRNNSYYLFTLMIKTTDGGLISFIQSAEPLVEAYPSNYGPAIGSLVPDALGLRVFMTGVQYQPTSISNIVYYDPGSQRFDLVYTVQQPIFDIAYHPVQRKLYVLADHMFTLNLDYISGSLLVPSTGYMTKSICNQIFGILQLGLEQQCTQSYPVIHFVEKPSPRKRLFEWNTMNGETGVCYGNKKNASVIYGGPIRKFAFYPRWFAVLYVNGSIFAAPRDKNDLHGSERSALQFIADGVTAMCGGAANVFKNVSRRCFLSTNHSHESLIATDIAAVNATSVRVATLYNPDSFSAACKNISFPSLAVRPMFPPEQICGEEACSDGMPYIESDVTAPGVITFTRLVPGFTYNVTISARGYYINKAGLYTVDKKVQFRTPGSSENRKAGIWIGVMVPFIALTLFGSCGVIVYKKRNQRNRKGPSVSNELYARLDGVSYYDNFQIKILNNGNPVGEGQFGQVFKGVVEEQPSNAGHSMNVAVKQVEDVALMQREAKIMAPLEHQNVVKLIGVCQDLLEYPCLILEWMDQGSLLYSLLKAKPLEPVQQKDIAVQVCRGLKYISDFGCVHRDIAARNVLINSLGCYKLADFGLSREIPVDKDYYRMISGGILPVKWMAPECLQRSPAALFSTKSDVWSFGVLLYEVLTSGSDPYPGLSAEEAINSIRQGGTPTIPSCYSTETQLLLHRCWTHEPDKRPSPSLLQELLDRWDTKAFSRPGIVGYVFSASQVHTVNRIEQKQQQPCVAIHRIENGITAAFSQRL